MRIPDLVLTLLLAPLFSALLSGLIPSRYSWLVPITASLSLLAGAVSSLILFSTVWNEPAVYYTTPWFSIAGNQIPAGVYIDNFSVLMVMLITIISFLVHLYSSGYMAGDHALRRYFAMLGFFTFSMLGLVLADNLLLIFFFWELVGFSSYLLIGHWTEYPNTGQASKKAFIVNRIGDLGFLVGIFIIWSNTGSFNISYLTTDPEAFSWQTAAALCFLWAAAGKSAQFPLLTWLPDAMAGPTPVSALIHAATMVTAGVFLLARIHLLFSVEALNIVAVTGAVTALVGGTSALFQYDIKKILAYSTISQLGLMMAAIGVGALDGFTLHLFSHAFFKAGLFLGAGAIIHTLEQAQHGSDSEFDAQDIRNLGGLKKYLPFTSATFIICGASLAGIPLFSGFLSKDAIIAQMLAWAQEGAAWRWMVLTSVFITSFLTVLYTFRLIWFTFFGEANKQIEMLKITEAPVAMRIPMVLLAGCSLWWILSVNPFHISGWLYQDNLFSSLLAIASALWVLGALGIGYTYFKNKTPSYTATSLTSIFYNTLYLDKFYQKTFVTWVNKISTYSLKTDTRVIDGALHLLAYAQVTLAYFVGWFDRTIVDGIVSFTAALARTIGRITRSFQSGKIQHYIFWSALGIVLLLILMLF